MPTGAVVVVIFSVPPLIANVRLPDVAVCGVIALSETWRVRFAAPAVVGVPAMTPAVLSDSPAGRVPLFTLQLYGAVPPVAARVVL